MVGLCLALTPALVCSQTLSRSGARSLEPAPTNAAVFAPNATITQGFDAGLACPVGWTCTNNSVPIGATVNWFDGNTTVFAPQAGSGYIGANFNMVTTTNTISAWLISPVVQFGTGAELRFWSRTVDIPTFPDRLEIRTSTGGTNTGGTNMSVGDFTNLLGTINPTLIATAGTCIVPAAAPNALGYPNAWCEYRLTNVDGIPTTGSGRVAFRYFVTDGGPTGDNSDYIGIDTFSFVEGVDCTNVVVTNANDSGAGSLRQAIADACPGSTITFQAGVGSVNLSSGEIVLDKDLTIQGPGAASLR
ncbi:MAG: choice-of-anchor J domain-containing protein, partial [Gammaproteobacteria bacterium]|nr:choice-of-anchor J domain-containing protein [Gammaproteobacteria bacterium]